ncbi:bJDP [Chrysodeixis chalcites nucleopolyhedrovirus]|uniref:BJDP n=1 Tax=Chrysodeixis chalcites nucleopolyhedrovirus TaxID=320432 RepID=Q4KT42_9ABAC|nr:bJDP [Chrysodeixis chalcites nucleopolyhedrovirus]AGC36253.1 bJDP protein [Chrysodeixis chalcites SNPV TF1-A]AAY83969.1 bJDP [Chrysodeixis chalcites nucleopolyhedrovirus]AGE61300.1 BJDP [Chrysodeixis chalcites nucleopolyhedrovirus]AGE61449.1 BJDP [Chrysodeixis chalcites nucleopolyhedrovirus]AGE61598.1 BJDP [Chrysodeixis chalcites nucleopolyhedrovirus]
MMSTTAMDIRPTASIRPVTRAFKRKMDQKTKRYLESEAIEDDDYDLSSTPKDENLMSSTTSLSPPPAKQAKIKRKNLFKINLDTQSFYDLLSLKTDSSDFQIKQRVNELIDFYSTAKVDDSSFRDDDDKVEVINSTNQILLKISQASMILTNVRAKRVYDKYIEIKYKIRLWQLNELRPLIDEIFKHIESIFTVSSDFQEFDDIEPALRNFVANELTQRRSRGKRLRSTTTNRLRIQWNVNLNDETNAGVDERYLLDYFGKYGEIVGIVMCSSRPGCAVIEFDTLRSVTEVISEESQLKRFIVQDLSEAELISSDSAAQLQSKLDELERLSSDLLSIQENINKQAS